MMEEKFPFRDSLRLRYDILTNKKPKPQVLINSVCVQADTRGKNNASQK